MPDFKLEIDAKDIASKFGDLQKEVEATVHKAVAALAASTHAKATELATNKLKSRASIYKDALDFKKIDKNIWVVSLDMEKAGFIEENRKSGFMDELLRGKSAKTSSKGKKYAIIPFKHNKNPSEQTEKAQDLSRQIKDFLKKEKIYSRKLEFNPDGSPKLGLLHRFDLDSAKPSSKAKNPALKGVSIYQRMNEHGQVKKEIMTFRVITEDHKSEGLWNHPGSKGVFIIDECFNWASSTWDTEILPSILDSFK
jgi:hypothetical protein